MPALQRTYDHFWADSPGPGGVGLASRFAAAWRHVAGRFRGDPWVLGYELGALALHTLVEPYPQLIAGTPRGWGFDRQTRTFTLRYTTARVAGHGRFRAGAVTEIAAPALIYAGHYAARVSGGAILSARDASVLQIAACPGARAISVRISPSGRSRRSCRRAGRVR
jgi:hypothetical protein